MKVGIVGAGASGLMAAISCAQEGHEVYVFEHMAKPGKKILLTGSGKCNLTNMDMDYSHFHGTNTSIVPKIISAFDNNKTLEFFNSIGLLTKEKNGYVYPYCEQASAVLDVLRFKARNLNAQIITDCDVRIIKYRQSAQPCESVKNDRGARFNVITSMGDYYFDAVIICAGSFAASKTGSDGSGYSLAEELGHKIVKPLPALTQLRCKEDFFASIAGVRAQGSVTLFVDGKEVAKDTGELQLNNYGISGIPVLQVSHLAAKAIDENKSVSASLCFMPDLLEDSDTMRDAILKCAILLKERFGNDYLKTAEEAMIGFLNKNLGNCILKRNRVSINTPANKLDNKQIAAIARSIMDFEVTVTSTNTFNDSQVCQGGVSTDDIKVTLESKICKSLYFAGEIIDIHGDCGGYNLQWAWSSGYVAGKLLEK